MLGSVVEYAGLFAWFSLCKNAGRFVGAKFLSENVTTGLVAAFLILSEYTLTFASHTGQPAVADGWNGRLWGRRSCGYLFDAH